jgi:ketose-bisphosphate aldolase
MKTLHEVLESADRGHTAVGHFNISDLVGLKAVYEAAKALNLPVLIGVSEGERDFMGVHEIAAVVRTLRKRDDFPVFLNADHTHSLDRAREAASAGFDMIVFDASVRSFDDNVRETREAVQQVKSLRPDILVEGEIGFIGASSSIHDERPNNMSPLTTPEEAREFVSATGVDILAPAVGNMHGMLKTMLRGETEKRIDPARIAAIKAAAKTFLTLHGGSGTNRSDFEAAIRAGITIIHVNTELRVAWRRGMDAALAQKPDEIVPYKHLPQVVTNMKQVVRERLELFSANVAVPPSG